MEGSGDAIEVVGHFQVRVIDCIVGAIGGTAPDRRAASGGEIVGVDVIGIHILVGDQRWQSPLQASQRQTIGGVDTGRAQDADGDAAPRPPGPQPVFGIDPALRPRVGRRASSGLVDPGTGTIAVNARGAYVDQTTW